MAGSSHHARTTPVTEDLFRTDWADGLVKSVLMTRSQGGERRTDGRLREGRKCMSKDKSYFGLTIEFMDKFSTANKEERAEMLEPMAVVMMWDSRMIDRNGMDNNHSKRFRDLANQVRPFIEAQPSGGIEMAEIERSGFMGQMLELQEIIDATSTSREILREYLKEGGKHATE